MLSLPIPLRLLLTAQPKLLARVLQVMHPVITRLLLTRADIKAHEADSLAVWLIQRSGSAANLNIHRHCQLLDEVANTSGVLVEGEGWTYMADDDGDLDEACALAPLQAAACTYRIASALEHRYQQRPSIPGQAVGRLAK